MPIEREQRHKYYREYRRKGWPPNWAIHQARTRVAWEKAEAEGVVRMRVEPDECSNLDDLLGDVYNPDVNTDIHPARLEREKEQEIQRINDYGVWGIIGEYKCPCCGEWTNADSVWGFVDEDWRDSGYDSDVMASTLEQHQQMLIGDEE